jgi:polyphosphate kinase
MLQRDFLPTLPSLLAETNTPLIHRDLSWLQFNERVLAEARAAINPLLARAKFLAISASNLDEFFMIRVASLGRSIAQAGKQDAQSASRLSRTRLAILENVAKFGAKQAEALDLLAGELESESLRVARHIRPGDMAFEIGRECFNTQVLPKLAPPEPFTSSKLNLLENLQLAVVFPSNLWFRIPKSLPPMIASPAGKDGAIHFFFMDELIAAHIGEAFRLDGTPAVFRITRDGDFTVDLEEEDTESIPDVVRQGLGSRDKGRPVRLQYWGETREDILRQAATSLRLDPPQIFSAPSSLNLHGLWAVVNQAPESISAKPGMNYPNFTAPVHPKVRGGAGVFDELKREDILLHHPYDSFDSYVNWILAACEDPAVEMIEQTIYRMDTLSPVVDALKKAASRKKIRAVIELRARFDELNNLALAEEMRKAGVEVAFGFGRLKLHAKIALVTRNEPEGRRLYTHLSTGNYNAQTARQYADLAVLTANQEVGEDARKFLDAVWKGEVPTSFKHLVSAPAKLHRRLLALIQAETDAAKAGRKARIVAKVNALVDALVIDQLYRASQAGVQVDLIVRGACSLIPGVKGLSENIRVISIVDRFLEHSRIYSFEDSKALYLSSADWMPRNFFSRLEIAFPVVDPKLLAYLSEVVIPTYLSDTVKARELTPQGTWKKRTVASVKAYGGTSKAVRSQYFFQELAMRGYEGTVLGG